MMALLNRPRDTMMALLKRCRDTNNSFAEET